ncbi:MAG: baseplate J/gp47 family protein [Thermoanaerobacter sp.]|nr:baseplate J/gp47 family protein [Thermoanaerobacter sp.]
MTRFNLPEITFAEKSVQQIEAEIMNAYEEAAGYRLAAADPRRKFLQAIAKIIAVQRSLIDFAAKQNLLAYSTGDYLDHIGAFSNTERLQPTYATTIERFNLSTAFDQIIPAGTRVTAGDNVFFATTKDVVVQGGQTYVDVEVQCTEAGTIGNGYLPGEINILVDPIQWVQSVENITESEGGADLEDDDQYAERIRQALESFSVAGPTGAYEYWARTTSQSIIDVAVRSPSAGTVEIRPLLENGEIPGQEILDAVLAVCNDKKIRPLTDQVQVLAPEQVSYDITLTYYIRTEDSSLESSIQERVNQAIEDYKLWQKSKLGRDIDPSELITRVKNAGAKRVTVTAPVYQQLEPYQVAVENLVTVTYGGLEDD